MLPIAKATRSKNLFMVDLFIFYTKLTGSSRRCSSLENKKREALASLFSKLLEKD
jgi:hypothetical protein